LGVGGEGEGEGPVDTLVDWKRDIVDTG